VEPQTSRWVSAYIYPIALAICSVFVMVLEALFPRRKQQKQLRATLPSDLLHLVFNGHFLGVILYGIAERFVLPTLHAWIDGMPVGIASSWPIWAQIVVVLVVFDFIQWCIHRLLHYVPWLWEFHKVHHSVVDGEMDYLVSFRFHWMEAVVYKSLQYLPLLFFGFGSEAIMVHAIFGTLIGHLNHSNLDWGHGAWRYVLNSPRMHLWHHDWDAAASGTKNFGIIFSAWDWIFGTAKMERDPPQRIGFEGVARFPRFFITQNIWPISRLFS
jgi:sterol desaturase/sphingolipid hydroxylase (fatty acid hydroxylase superfamily)